jgi:hypothetical protein
MENEGNVKKIFMSLDYSSLYPNMFLFSVKNKIRKNSIKKIYGL